MKGHGKDDSQFFGLSAGSMELPFTEREGQDICKLGWMVESGTLFLDILSLSLRFKQRSVFASRQLNIKLGDCI